MLNVSCRLIRRQRADFISHRYALTHLTQLMRVQQLHQFRLADQHDLDQLVTGRLEIGDQPDLFQHRRRQNLGIIDECQHFSPGDPFFHQKAVQCVGQLVGGLRADCYSEAAVHALQELGRAGNGA